MDVSKISKRKNRISNLLSQIKNECKLREVTNKIRLYAKLIFRTLIVRNMMKSNTDTSKAK